jgi:outer membrane lipoprotein-sorting protein
VNDDELLGALRGLDPVSAGAARAGAPPGPGSDRYHQILERAMHPTDLTLTNDNAVGPADSAPAPPPVRRRYRRVAALAAAAVTVGAVATGVGLLGPDGAPSPAAALSRAADATAEVASLRATLTQTGDGNEHRSEIAVSGADMRIESYGTYADGHVEGSTTVVIDDQITQVALDGSVETSTIGDDSERLRPFAASSAAVVDTVLAGGDVTDLGAESVDGVDARHYRIDLDSATRQALAELDPIELAWFELEYPDEVTNLDVWVAEDLIRRIDITSEISANGPPETVTTRVDYFDLNSDVTISPLG